MNGRRVVEEVVEIKCSLMNEPNLDEDSIRSFLSNLQFFSALIKSRYLFSSSSSTPTTHSFSCSYPLRPFPHHFNPKTRFHVGPTISARSFRRNNRNERSKQCHKQTSKSGRTRLSSYGSLLCFFLSRCCYCR